MKSMNRVQLIGHLGGDPELREINQSPFTSFNLATSESFKTDDGEWHTRTEWHKVVVWGRKAEQICQYCMKGTKIYMEGQLKHRSYQDKDGVNRYITEVKLDDFSLASDKKVKSSLQEPELNQPDSEDDDLPF